MRPASLSGSSELPRTRSPSAALTAEKEPDHDERAALRWLRLFPVGRSRRLPELPLAAVALLGRPADGEGARPGGACRLREARLLCDLQETSGLLIGCRVSIWQHVWGENRPALADELCPA
jgi:hypothetical protein